MNNAETIMSHLNNASILNVACDWLCWSVNGYGFYEENNDTRI